MFGSFAEKFHTVVKTAFHVKRWSFQERTNLSKKTDILNFFGNSSVKFTEFGDNFMHGCLRCVLHVQTNNSRKIWCLGIKFTVFITFEFWSKYVRSFCEKYGTVVKTAFRVYRWSCREKERISWITHNFLHFFENSSVKLTEIGENFMHSCQNCIFQVQRKNSRKNGCWRKKFYCFYHFWIVFNICLEFLQKKFGTVVKTAFHVWSWSFQERTNLSNKTEVLNFFGNSSVKFTAFGESFQHGCQNCIFQVQRKNSRKNGCWRKKFYCFYHFWILIKVFKSFCEKLSARWSKLSSTSTDDASEKEEQISLITHLLFWEFESQFYGVWCKLHAWLSKLPSTRTKEQFEKNLKWGKKFAVLSLLNFIQNRFGVVAKKFRHGGLNCISRQRLIIPRKNKTLE